MAGRIIRKAGKAALFLIKGCFTLLFLALKLACLGLRSFLRLLLCAAGIVLACVSAGE